MIMQELTQTDIVERLDLLTEVSVALGDGHDDIDIFLDRILKVAKSMTNADGGTLYRPSADGRSLCFHIWLNDTLGIRQGGTSGSPIDLPPIPLVDDAGEKNLASVAAYAANFHRSVNIADVYRADVFNFSGMLTFDETFGYRSQSNLTVPMTDHEGELVGVLQLINARDRDVSFNTCEPACAASLVAAFACAWKRHCAACASGAPSRRTLQSRSWATR